MSVTPQRIKKLKKALAILEQADIKKLTPQKRQIFLSGFCLAKHDEDIIYKICYNVGRDVMEQIENFLKEHDK